MKKDITKNTAPQAEETKVEQTTSETNTTKSENLVLDVKMEKAKQKKELEDRIRYGNFNQLKEKK